MRKAQAAMEFLMTYGWAILVVLAAIAALAYFGVLSPSKMLPETATGFTGLMAPGKPTADKTAGYIALTLVNNIGNINITGASFDTNDCTVTSVYFCPVVKKVVDPNCLTAGTGSFTSKLIEEAEELTVVIKCDLTDIERVKGDLTINYTDMNTGLPGKVTGTIQVQPK